MVRAQSLTRSSSRSMRYQQQGRPQLQAQGSSARSGVTSNRQLFREMSTTDFSLYNYSSRNVTYGGAQNYGDYDDDSTVGDDSLYTSFRGLDEGTIGDESLYTSFRGLEEEEEPAKKTGNVFEERQHSAIRQASLYYRNSNEDDDSEDNDSYNYNESIDYPNNKNGDGDNKSYDSWGNEYDEEDDFDDLQTVVSALTTPSLFSCQASKAGCTDNNGPDDRKNHLSACTEEPEDTTERTEDPIIPSFPCRDNSKKSQQRKKVQPRARAVDVDDAQSFYSANYTNTNMNTNQHGLTDEESVAIVKLFEEAKQGKKSKASVWRKLVLVVARLTLQKHMETEEVEGPENSGTEKRTTSQKKMSGVVPKNKTKAEMSVSSHSSQSSTSRTSTLPNGSTDDDDDEETVAIAKIFDQAREAGNRKKEHKKRFALLKFMSQVGKKLKFLKKKAGRTKRGSNAANADVDAEEKEKAKAKQQQVNMASDESRQLSVEC